MIKEEYKNGCRLKEQVKYNIDYDDCQILNLTCANYIYDLVQESSKYETKLEDVKKMLYMIEKLLGHEVQYDIPEYHGDNKKCYFGVVSDNFVINEDNIKQLDYVLQDTKEFVKSFSTDYQKILYCYPNEFGDINSIKDQNQFEIKESFQRNAVTIDGILYKDIVKYIDYKDIPTLNMVANLGGVSIEYIKGKPVISGDMYVSKMGTTQERPANIINKGFQYFDTTINKPIFWDGAKWIDATGATV